jgi:hypothetical protein
LHDVDEDEEEEEGGGGGGFTSSVLGHKNATIARGCAADSDAAAAKTEFTKQAIAAELQLVKIVSTYFHKVLELTKKVNLIKYKVNTLMEKSEVDVPIVICSGL